LVSHVVRAHVYVSIWTYEVVYSNESPVGSLKLFVHMSRSLFLNLTVFVPFSYLGFSLDHSVPHPLYLSGRTIIDSSD